MSEELPIIQKTYDLITWMVPIIDRLPRTHRFTLGDRIIQELYNLLDSLIAARYTKANRLSVLRGLNTRLQVLRYQCRLLMDFKLVSLKRYEYMHRQINDIGQELGGWIRQVGPRRQDGSSQEAGVKS
ncbi:MAG: diversity-generating retroelement protein Avd [Cyanobacteria bacterium P01_F01_bin.86]